MGDGWAVKRNDAQVVTLGREEGLWLVTNEPSLVDASQGDGGDGKADAWIAAVAATDGVKATKPANVRIDGHHGRSTDVVASGDSRVAILQVDGTTLYAEAGRTSRIVALDVDGAVVLLVIEPAEGQTLRALLDTADDVAASFRFE